MQSMACSLGICQARGRAQRTGPVPEAWAWQTGRLCCCMWWLLHSFAHWLKGSVEPVCHATWDAGPGSTAFPIEPAVWWQQVERGPKENCWGVGWDSIQRAPFSTSRGATVPPARGNSSHLPGSVVSWVRSLGKVRSYHIIWWLQSDRIWVECTRWEHCSKDYQVLYINSKTCWGVGSVVDDLFIMCKALGSTPSTTKTKNKPSCKLSHWLLILPKWSKIFTTPDSQMNPLTWTCHCDLVTAVCAYNRALLHMRALSYFMSSQELSKFYQESLWLVEKE
jgi:hypothetical protein